jgi:hypothetical protein
VASTFFKLVINEELMSSSFDEIVEELATDLGLAKPPMNNNVDIQQYTNLELIVMNVSDLKEICGKHGLKKNGNKQDIINRILLKQSSTTITLPGIDNENLIFDKVKSELFKTWFLRPNTTNTPMKVGRECEPRIATKITNFASKYGYVIKNVAEIGLVKSQSSNYLATLIDRLAIHRVYDSPTNQEIYLDKVIGIEIKCSTTNETREESITRIRTYTSRFICCEFGDEDFKKLVWKTSY